MGKEEGFRDAQATGERGRVAVAPRILETVLRVPATLSAEAAMRVSTESSPSEPSSESAAHPAAEQVLHREATAKGRTAETVVIGHAAVWVVLCA